MDRLALERKITEYCTREQIFGMLRVTHKDTVLYRQEMGYADCERRIPFTDASLFSLYSLSKPFCALGLLKLKDAGLVDLNLHPGYYVPEAAAFDSRVTLRHLLHHVSGLPDAEQIGEFAAKFAPGYPAFAREHIRELAKYPSFFAPGTDTKYANINFILPALVIENVTGENYADYMAKEIFAPLGMKTAVVDHEKREIPHRVTGYALKNGVPVPEEKSHNWLLGAGDIVGTADDVYGLNRAIKHRLLLREETWDEVLTAHPINSFGMGCSVYSWHGLRCIHHNGGHIGFRTLHMQLPEEDFDIILLSNSGYGDARRALAEMVYAAFFGEEGKNAEMPEMDKGYIR